MSEPQHEDLWERIETLEASQRRWRMATLILGGVLSFFLLTAVVVGISQQVRLQAAMVQAVEQQRRAEDNERQARDQLQRALEAEMLAREAANGERDQAKARSEAQKAKGK